MPNFRHIRPFMASLECPKIFGPFRVQDQVPRAQKKKFKKKKKKKKKKEKKKKHPGIRPSNKCAKFQTDFTIYSFPRPPQTLWYIHHTLSGF